MLNFSELSRGARDVLAMERHFEHACPVLAEEDRLENLCVPVLGGFSHGASQSPVLSVAGPGEYDHFLAQLFSRRGRQTGSE